MSYLETLFRPTLGPPSEGFEDLFGLLLQVEMRLRGALTFSLLARFSSGSTSGSPRISRHSASQQS